MTFAGAFYDWQHGGPHPELPAKCSPNLQELQAFLQVKWTTFLPDGCYGVRPIRGGALPSSHSYGAAIDLAYSAADDESVIAGQAIPFLVAWSAELGIDAVHDYRRCRIWRAARTSSTDDACTTWWKAQRPDKTTGMGQSWANHLHIETDPDRWQDGTPIAERGVT